MARLSSRRIPLALLLAACALLAPGMASAAAQIVVNLSVDPPQPRVGEPSVVTLRISSASGPIQILLLAAYPIVASDATTGRVISATALPSGNSDNAYTTTLTFPSPGLWHVSSPNWGSTPGDDLVVDVAAAGAPPACQFRLGFAALHALIPAIVGNCLTDETYADNGDSLQQTTNGLLVWRKADNWTAFTDGATTWINGPVGLQSRPNDQRFPWERG